EYGTPILTVVNDALQAAGFTAIWADVDGTLRSAKDVKPRNRPVVWDFNDLPEESISMPEFEVADDFYDAPNKVLVESMGDGEEEGLRAEAVNMDPDDRLSYWNRHGGTWNVRVESGVEATSLAVLEAHAERLLQE